MFKKTWDKCIVLFTVLALTIPAMAADSVDFETAYEMDTIYLQPLSDFAGFSVKVAGPDGIEYTMDFNGDQTPFVSIVDDMGNMLPDGLYRYEIVASPILDRSTKRAMNKARNENIDIEPAQGSRKNGVFTIAMGEILDPDISEPLFTANKGDTEDTPATYVVDDADSDRAQVYATDLIVQGSECVGFDCASSESFGSDTLRLKENNLRIHFNDTSSSGSFPSNDWRIVANDTSNGGAEYLAIEDSTAGTKPLRVDAGAGNNAIYVESGGHVGFGNSNPAVELHATGGNSPALRLEQDGSSGFASQIWDIASNETNFFIRDVTNGSKLPFRIKPGSGNDNALYIDSNGEIGLGDTSPDAKLDVEDGGILVDNAANNSTEYSLNVKNTGADYPNTRLENLTDTVGTRAVLQIRNKGLGKVQMTNTAYSWTWAFGTENNKDFILYSDNGADATDITLSQYGDLLVHNSSNTEIFNLDNTGNLTVAGTVSKTSNRHAKENFVQEDPLDILNRVAALPITSWNYKADQNGVRHIGPMAQDFYAAFGFGIDEKHIADGDTTGIALASIQALNALVEAKDAKIAKLQETLNQQEARLSALEAALLK